MEAEYLACVFVIFSYFTQNNIYGLLQLLWTGRTTWYINNEDGEAAWDPELEMGLLLGGSLDCFIDLY